MSEFSHTDSSGKAKMVNVGSKPDMYRTATASGKIIMSEETVSLIRKNEMKKGDVLTVAQIAGIQAAKRTSELIPLCHPLQISNVEVDCILINDGVEVRSTVFCIGKTGVEMEALTAVNVALLSVYDMCKAVDKKMRITDIELILKTKEIL